MSYKLVRNSVKKTILSQVGVVEVFTQDYKSKPLR